MKPASMIAVIFLLHGVGNRGSIGIFGRIKSVGATPARAHRCRDGHEGFADRHGRDRRLQIVDIAFDRGMSDVGDRPSAFPDDRF